MIKLSVLHRNLSRQIGRVEKSIDEICAQSNGFSKKLYLQQARFKGKRLRPILLFLSAQATGNIKSIHEELAVIIELIHNATLIHDDVLDEACLRRNLPTVNNEWGNEIAVIFGDLVLSNAFKICAKINNSEVTRIISQMTNQICHGELAHMEKKYDLSVTEKEYLKIIGDKTAVLFSTSCYLGTLFSSPDKKNCSIMEEFGFNFGMAYQIIDDCLDWVSSEKLTGKTGGTDIAKGRITMPLIRLYKILPKNRKKKLENLISLDRQNESTYKEVKFLLEENKILPEVINSAAAYLEKASSILNHLVDTPGKRLLEEITESILAKYNHTK
jgi:octaprenyl-diphosphate synthase